jgi:polyhydroxybutyrate depolymerase
MNVDSLWKTSDTAGFLVVYPHGTDNSWNSGPYCCGNNTNDDVGLMRALIDTLAVHYSVDRDRVYAVGCSNGAMMANRLGAEAADVFAAVAGVAGPLALSATDSELSPARPISVMDFHALIDQGVPYNGGFGGGAPAETLAMARWASADGCDIGPTLTAYDNLTAVKTWKKSNSPVEVICTRPRTANTGGRQRTSPQMENRARLKSSAQTRSAVRRPGMNNNYVL